MDSHDPSHSCVIPYLLHKWYFLLIKLELNPCHSSIEQLTFRKVSQIRSKTVVTLQGLCLASQTQREKEVQFEALK